MADTELTAELIVDSVSPREPVISPDGRWVAYVTTASGVQEKRVSELRVAAADASSPPRRLTDGSAWVEKPRWAPDSAALFFLSAEQLHRIHLDGGDAEALTSWRGGISASLPLADGKLVAVLAADEPDKADRDPIVWSERVPYARLRLLDLSSREITVVSGLGDRHVTELIQRPDGGPLAVITWSRPEDEPGSHDVRLHVVHPETGIVEDLGPAAFGAGSPAWWHADGSWRLGYVATTPPALIGGLAVLEVPVPGGGPTAGEHRNLTAGMTVCPNKLVQVTDGPPLALFQEGLDSALYRLAPATGRFSRVTTMTGAAEALSASASGTAVAMRMSTAYQPMDVYAGPPEGPFSRLSDTKPELRQITIGTQERLSYQASDGLVLDGLLVLPPGRSRADGPFPLITVVHGGPDSRQADSFTAGWWPPAQWFAAGGYAVFMPNPRGGYGHGHEFAAAVENAVGMGEWTDILAGIDLLVAGGVADPDRLGIGGWSHGGFMTAWAVGQTGRFKAAVMGAGICDWSMQVASGDYGIWDSTLSGSCGWEGTGPHRHDQLSPISYASKISTPVLILHGQNDTNVLTDQSIYFHRALLQYGVEHELVLYPREAHSPRERAHQIDILQRMRAWFDRWLRPPK
jgi:dipeptidyl aminopeptidase/acylaminoacyl peptidase